MDKILTIKREGNWAKLLGNLNGKLSLYIRNYIKPTSYRKFEKGSWLVYFTKLPEVISVASKDYNSITYIEVPEEWKSGTSVIIDTSESYKCLYLQENAPLEVVKAAYKALAIIYHPDHHQGSSDQMIKLNQAYETITKERETK